MQTMNRAAAKAYATGASHRNPRDQEADVFRRVNGALKASRGAGTIALAKALADNRRLWTAVSDLVRDPENELPQDVKVSLASLGRSVQRELDKNAPDLDFLISINDHIAAGLSGAP